MSDMSIPIPDPLPNPLDDVLVPVDVVTPHGTIRAGTRLSVVIARMNVLYGLLATSHPSVDPKRDDIEAWKVFFGDGSSRVYPTDYSIHHFTSMGMAAMPLYCRTLPDEEEL